MSPEAQAILREWSPPIGVNLALACMAWFYIRGWIFLRRTAASPLSNTHLFAFLGGILALWIAIGSPLAAFDESCLTVHMVQHLLLMFAAPPLLLFGAPVVPFLHGLPQFFVRTVLGSLFRRVWVQRLGTFLAHPAVCWFLATVTMIAWHIPSTFELALRSDVWHEAEHFCFLTTSLLLWWPVVQPFPSQPRWSQWSIPIYLLLAMFPGSALGAFLAFYDRVLYPSYITAPQIFGMTPLTDQILAGVLMWVSGIFIFGLPVVLVTLRLLSPVTKTTRFSS
jgi:cytochrome c oxidase assembly factor CtaG